MSAFHLHQLQLTRVFQHLVIWDARQEVKQLVVGDGARHDQLPGELVDAPEHDDDPAGDEEQEDGDDREDDDGQPGEEGDREVESVLDSLAEVCRISKGVLYHEGNFLNCLQLLLDGLFLFFVLLLLLRVVLLVTHVGIGFRYKRLFRTEVSRNTEQFNKYPEVS